MNPAQQQEISEIFECSLKFLNVLGYEAVERIRGQTVVSSLVLHCNAFQAISSPSTSAFIKTLPNRQELLV
jgi:hypothetical protein